MITKDESGLTLDQYNALANTTSGATWSITAHKYNLDFTEVGVDQGRDDTLPNFDAAACQGYLFRTVGDLYMERFNTASASWEQVMAYTGLDPASSIDTDGAQVIVDGDDLFVFVAETSGIWMQHTSDAGATFSSWSHVTSDANVNKIAVVNKNRVHYTVEDTDNNIFNLRVAKYNSSWTSTDSDIWYTYAFSNFVAAELPDGSDVIVAATQVPGITTVKLVVNVPTTYIKQQGGIIAFKYKNNWWGDHYDVDVVDELTAYRFRDRIKLTQFSDRVALTCYSSDGTQLFPYTMYRMYTTKDGSNWSKGNALPLPEDPGSSGIKLCQIGDYVYAIEKSRAYKSFMTLALGFSPTVFQIEIPKRHITNLSLSEGDMMQGSLTLSNEDGWLNDDTIISKNNRTVLVFKMGYWSEGEKLEVQTHMAEIDTYDMSTQLPRHMVRVTFRDFLSWMTDINLAERPFYWDSQLLGGDNFVDTSDDKYGGLRHLEPQAGSFTSEGSILNLTSNNEEGVGFSTFSLYLWNGITQSQFTLSTATNFEYGGVTFRSIDKDNFWSALYYQGDDKISLFERSGGTPAVKSSTGTLGWANTPLTPRWIQVEFRYAHVIVRYSLDGITWVNCIDYLMPMSISDIAPDLNPIANSNKERGYTGFVGRGYAPPDVEAWPDDPAPYDPPSYYPPEPPYFPPYDPNYQPYVPGVFVPSGGTGVPGTGLNTTGNPHKAVTGSLNGDVYRTRNLDANQGTADWELAFTLPHHITSYLKDPKKSARRWFGTLEGLYVCENIWAASATATLKATSAAMFNQSGAPVFNIVMSEKRPNWMIVQNINQIYSLSETLGNLWNCLDMTNGSAATGVPFDINNGLTFGSWADGMCAPYGDTSGYLMSVHGEYDGNWHYRPYWSEDWGHHWTAQTFRVPVGLAGFVNTRVYAPYRRRNNAINTVNAATEVYWYSGASGNDGVGVAYSLDAGKTNGDDIGTTPLPGLGQLRNPGWFASSVPNYGDQGMYNNPQTHKRSFMVLVNVGGNTQQGVVYSKDDWASFAFMPGFTYGFDASFGNTRGQIHITGYPSNWNFLLVAQEAYEAISGSRGSIIMTPNLGENWFNITPQGMIDSPDIGVPYIQSGQHPVFIDCEA